MGRFHEGPPPFTMTQFIEYSLLFVLIGSVTVAVAYGLLLGVLRVIHWLLVGFFTATGWLFHEAICGAEIAIGPLKRSLTSFRHIPAEVSLLRGKIDKQWGNKVVTDTTEPILTLVKGNKGATTAVSVDEIPVEMIMQSAQPEDTHDDVEEGGVISLEDISDDDVDDDAIKDSIVTVPEFKRRSTKETLGFMDQQVLEGLRKMSLFDNHPFIQ